MGGRGLGGGGGGEGRRYLNTETIDERKRFYTVYVQLPKVHYGFH